LKSFIGGTFGHLALRKSGLEDFPEREALKALLGLPTIRFIKV
jgi:hypothetical protein